MWPETLPRVRFASRPKIPPKFSTLSRSTSNPRHLVTFPTSSPSTAPNYPRNHNLGKVLVAEHTNRIASYRCSGNRPPDCYLLLLSSFRGYLALSLHWQTLSVPCLQLPTNSDCHDNPLSPSKPPLQRHSLPLSHNIHILRPSILKAGCSKTCFEQSLR